MQVKLNPGDEPRLAKFYCYRYAVIPNAQMSIWSDIANSKRHVVDELVRHCSTVGPFQSNYYGADNVLVYNRPLDTKTHLFKFCKRRSVKRFEIETDGSDVIQREEDSFPYAYLIVNLEWQVVLIERKPDVFKNPGGAKGAFSALVKTFMADDNYYFSLDEITATASFWDTVESADAVFDVTLKLKSPNFLGAGYTTTELLSRIKKVSNNDSVTVRLEDESGRLQVPRSEFEDAVEYATAGGGTWAITTSSGGAKRIRHKSDEFVREVELTIGSQGKLIDDGIAITIREIGAKKEA